METETIEDLPDVDLSFDHILTSDFQIHEGVFFSSSCHRDLSTYIMVYDSDRHVAVVRIGPMVKSIREYTPMDMGLINVLGPKVVGELTKFICKK